RGRHPSLRRLQMQVATTAAESRQPELYAAISQFPVRIDVGDIASLGSLDPHQLVELARRAIDEASPEAAERVLALRVDRRPDLDYGNYALSITFWPGEVEVYCDYELLLTVKTDAASSPEPTGAAFTPAP